MISIFHLGENIRTLSQIFLILRKHQSLTWELTKRDLGSRYVGQWMGGVWTIAHPLFLISIYVFIFSFVMGTRLGGTREMPLDYTAFILSGIIPWMFSQEIMSRSTTAITANAKLVKQVVFPIEVLPITNVYTACITYVIALCALAVYMTATGQWHLLMLPMLPIVILLHVGFMIGLAFALSAISVFFRDLKELVQLFSTVGLFLAPIIYLPQWVPSIFKPFLYINPFSYIVWCYRDVLYYGRFDHPWSWLIVGIISFYGLMVGYRTFRKLKPYFGDVL